MILLKVDKRKAEPVFKQIFHQIIQLIEKGNLKVGDKLPSTRRLAEHLGIHRTTVYRAYEELWSAGYIESNIGGYSRVRERTRLASKQNEKNTLLFNWEGHFSETSKRLTPSISISENADNVLDFCPLSPDKKLMPQHDFRLCMNEILKERGDEILDYGDVKGFNLLRKELARQLGQHGISVTVDEIILTNGIQNGLQMVFQLLCNKGDTIVLEKPTYPRGIQLLKLMGINIIDIPTDGNGMDLRELEKQLKIHKPKAIYTMPTFHNPMGISTTQIHRELLLKLCIKYNVPLIEDGFEEEMKYFGKAVLPIKSMDKSNIVVYMGTFSKVLFPGVRVGWIVADKRLIDKLAAIKQTSELAGNSVTQAAIYKFCEKGKYELHKMRLHRVYRKRMQVALTACKKYLPANRMHVTKPEGGYLLWFTLFNTNIKESYFIQLLLNKGVAVSTGSNFYAGKSMKVQFRISIAHRNEEEIEEGIRRIKIVLDELMLK